MSASAETGRERSVTLTALFASIGRVPLWGMTTAATLVLSAVVAWPWLGWFQGTLGDAYGPGEQLVSLDAVFRQDHRAGLASLNAATSSVGAWVALLAILANVFFAGGWLQVFLERTEGHSVQRFFLGGARYFFRFVRVLLLSLVVLGVADWLIFGEHWERWIWGELYSVVDGDLNTLADEWTATKLQWQQQTAFLLVFALTSVWATFTRTRMALHETRSALVAGLSTFFTLLTHPIRTLRPMLLLTVLDVVGLALAALVTGWLEGGLDAESGSLRVWSMGAVGALALAWGCAIRGARYCAAVHVSREVVAPLAAPDPWSRRVGGPGGPQYPIEEEDDYGVSL